MYLEAYLLCYSKMKKLFILLSLACSVQIFTAEASVDEPDYKLSDKAKETLSILEEEIFKEVSFMTNQFEATMAMFKKRLEKSGIKVRLKLRDREQDLEFKADQGSQGNEVAFVNIPLKEFMYYFSEHFAVGYIIYEDGSITYMDKSGCGLPSAGVRFFKRQFDDGHPENFDEETGKWKTLNLANSIPDSTSTK